MEICEDQESESFFIQNSRKLGKSSKRICRDIERFRGTDILLVLQN